MPGFYREKKTHCGCGRNERFREIDIYPYSDEQELTLKAGRGKRRELTSPKQKRLNDGRAARYLEQLTKTNFTENDLYITSTYNKENLPADMGTAENDRKNFIKRVKAKYKKLGLPPPKYVAVTSNTNTKNGEIARIHHHFVISGGASRDLIEQLWRRPRKKGQKKGDKIGKITADRFDGDQAGNLAVYLHQNKKSQEYTGKKKWISSMNLEKPTASPPADRKYKPRTIEKLSNLPEDSEEMKRFFERDNKGFAVTSINKRFNEVTANYSFIVKMKRRE